MYEGVENANVVSFLDFWKGKMKETGASDVKYKHRVVEWVGATKALDRLKSEEPPSYPYLGVTWILHY